jgi:carbonic anhydrase
VNVAELMRDGIMPAGGPGGRGAVGRGAGGRGRPDRAHGYDGVPMVDELLAGHGRFRAEYVAHERAFLEHLARAGQRPSALFIGCSDSRVIPELLTDAAPGELFVVRNVANIVPAREAGDQSIPAALEFAVGQLAVHDIVVCGHDGCGGVTAALDGLPGIEPDSELAAWLDGLAPAVARARALDLDPDTELRRAVEENVLEGIANLVTIPTVAVGLQAGRLRLHGWVYDLLDASLRVYDAAQDAFVSQAEVRPV